MASHEVRSNGLRLRRTVLPYRLHRSRFLWICSSYRRPVKAMDGQTPVLAMADPMPLRRSASKSYGNGRYPFQLSVNLQASFSETTQKNHPGHNQFL